MLLPPRMLLPHLDAGPCPPITTAPVQPTHEARLRQRLGDAANSRRISRSTQGLRIKIGKMGNVEKPAPESDFDQYPEKPGDFLNIVT